LSGKRSKPRSGGRLSLTTGGAPGRALYKEILDFLVSSPTPEEIIDFKLSNSGQERLDDLLDKNGEAKLRSEESAELEQYLQYRHTMILLKASARRVVDMSSD
jgi:hypothetical protein